MFNALHAEVCLGAGRVDAAVASIDRALSAVEATGERWYEAELHRLRGEALMAVGRGPAEARNEFSRAIEIATAQSAVALRHRAEASLAAIG